MANLEDKIELLKKSVKEYPDFPKKGVLFRDLFSIFADPGMSLLLREVLVAFAEKIEPRIEGVAALDARGFLLGPLIALELKVPFIPLRKKGKLPGKTISVSYSLEYGESSLEVQSGVIQPGQRFLIVDDLLATGGSLNAACQLITQENGVVAACLVLMELAGLNGRSKLPPSSNIISIIKY